MADVCPIVIGLDTEDGATRLPVVAALDARDEAIRAPIRLVRQEEASEGTKAVEVSKSMVAVAPPRVAADIEPTELRAGRRRRERPSLHSHVGRASWNRDERDKSTCRKKDLLHVDPLCPDGENRGAELAFPMKARAPARGDRIGACVLVDAS